MITEKEYNDFKNHNFEKGDIPINAHEVVQKLQEKVETLEEQLENRCKTCRDGEK